MRPAPQEALALLEERPELAPQFKKKYNYLPAPQEAINLLREKPELKPQFHQKYGYVPTDLEEPGRLQTAGAEFVKGAGDISAGTLKGFGIQQGKMAQNTVSVLDAIDRGEITELDQVNEKFGFTANDYNIADVNQYIKGKEAPIPGLVSWMRGESDKPLRQRLREKNIQLSGDDFDPTKTEAYQAGEAIDKYLQKKFKSNPEFAEEFIAGKVPRGLGSMVGFIGQMLVGRGLGGGSGATLSGLTAGAAVNSQSQFIDAIENGASLEDAFKAADIGALVGTSEVVPIASILNRLDKGSGGLIKRSLVNAAKGGTEEAIQEVFQQVTNNLAAADWVAYDPERGVWTGTDEGASVGFTTGALVSALGTLIGGRRRQSDLPAPEPDAAADTSIEAGISESIASIGSASTVDEAIDTANAQIDDIIDQSELREQVSTLEDPIAEEDALLSEQVTQFIAEEGQITPEAKPEAVSGDLALDALETPKTEDRRLDPVREDRGTRRRLQNPKEYLDQLHREKITEMVNETGVSREQAEKINAKFAPSIETDKTTGYYEKRNVEPAITRAQAHAKETGEPVFYAEVDLANMGGGNKAKGGSTVRFDREFYTPMAQMLREEIEATGGDVIPIRVGGDELGFVVANTDEKSLETALTSASAKTAQMAIDQGMGDITNPKYPDSTERGINLYFGITPVEQGKTPEQIREIADTKVGLNKVERNENVNRETAAAPGALSSEGQTRGAEDSTSEKGTGAKAAQAGSQERANQVDEGTDSRFEPEQKVPVRESDIGPAAGAMQNVPEQIPASVRESQSPGDTGTGGSRKAERNQAQDTETTAAGKQSVTVSRETITDDDSGDFFADEIAEEEARLAESQKSSPGSSSKKPRKLTAKQAVDRGYIENVTDIDEFNNLVKQAHEQGHVFNRDTLQDLREIVGDSGIRYSKTKSLGFFSGLKRAADSLKQEKGTAAQYLAQIKKQPGVKAEEMEWTGLEEYLKALGPNKITKQEIVDFLDANGIQVEEVVKRQSKELPDGYTYSEFPDGINIYNDQGEVVGEGQDLNSALNNLDGTKYHEHTLHGGKNYREVLFKLPESKPAGIDWQKSGNYTVSNTKGVTAKIERLQNGKYRLDQGAGITSLHDSLELAKSKVQDGSLDKKSLDTSFYTNHFDEPNILAHIRLNDRTDADGNKVLFIEELQSDWHQEGKRKGYVFSSEKTNFEKLEAELKKSREELRLYRSALADKHIGIHSGSSFSQFMDVMTDEEISEYNRLETNINSAEQGLRELRSSGGKVPNAPFKNNAWVELAIKRVLRMAAEGGYDSVAWTTGEQQADRYDLSKQVDSITAENVASEQLGRDEELYLVDIVIPGRGLIGIEVENGNIRTGEFSGKELSDVVGKDMAEKIFAIPKGGLEKFSGDNLKVGGEGMKGFYDKTLPNLFKKVSRKLDKNTSVSETTFLGKIEERGDDFDAWAINLTDKMRDSVMSGQPLFSKSDKPGKGLPKKSLESIVKSFRDELKGVPDIDYRIAEKQESAFGKQSQEKGVVKGAYDAKSGTIILVAENIESSADASRVLRHETLGHFGLGALPADISSEVINKIKAAKGTKSIQKFWDSVDTDYPEASESVKAEEVFARIAEDKMGRLTKLFNEIIALIQKGLRQAGLIKAPVTKAELRNMVEIVAKNIKEGPINQIQVTDGAIKYQKVFHGTSHDFDKFSLEAIGTGEGAQAFGWGLYFAENKDVAEYYRNVIFGDKPSREAFNLEPSRKVNTGASTQYYRTESGQAFSGNTPISDKEYETAYQLALSNYESKKGNIVKANIPEDADLLDWDKKIEDQSAQVRSILDNSDFDGDSTIAAWKDNGAWPNISGQTLYRHLAKGLTVGSVKEGHHKEASKFLNKLGIPGLKYLDALSRGNDKGSSNYVIWDENFITIDAVNDQLKQAEELDTESVKQGDEKYSKSRVNQSSAVDALNSVKQEMVDRYNQYADSDQTMVDRFVSSSDSDNYFYEVYENRKEIESIFGDDIEDWPDGLAEALEKNPDTPIVSHGSNSAGFDYEPANKAPTSDEFWSDAASEEGWTGSQIDSFDEILSGDTDAFALSEAAKVFFDSLSGWDYANTASSAGSDYFDLSKPAPPGSVDMDGEPIEEIIVGVRVSNHSKTSDVGHAVHGKADVHINIAPKTGGRDNDFYPAHSFEQAAEKLDSATLNADGELTFDSEKPAVKYSKTKVVERPKQTDTKAFQDWFGDSKVVDENGEPLVVYHGTASDISQFDSSALGINTQAKSAKKAFFFSSSSEVATGYAKLTNPIEDGEIVYGDDLYDSSGKFLGSGGANLLPVFLSIKNPRIVDFKGKNLGFNKEIVKAINDGNDGVVFKNADDAAHKDHDEISDIYAVFEPEQIKSAIGNKGTFDPNNPNIRFSKKKPVAPEAFEDWVMPNAMGGYFSSHMTKKQKLGSVLRKTRRKLQDKFVIWQDVQKEIDKRGGKLTDFSDAYNKFTLIEGKVGSKFRNLFDEHIKPLVNDLVLSDVSIQELGDYLYAQFAPQRNKRIAEINPEIPEGGSGLTDEQAKQILDNFSPAKTKQLERQAQRVYAMLRHKLDILVSSGRMTSELRDDLLKDDRYVPLKGFADASDLVTDTNAIGRGFDQAQDVFKRAKGRKSMAAELLLNAVRDTENAIISAEKNRVGQAVLKMVMDNPNENLWKVNPIKIQRVFNKRSGQVEQRVITNYKALARDPNVFITWVDGKPLAIEFKDNPNGESALARAVKNMGVDSVPWYAKYLSAYNRWLSYANTALSPEFILTNPIRDVQTAMVKAFGDFDAKIAGQVFKNLPKAMRGTIGGIGESRVAKKIADWNPKWTAYFKEYEAEGGKTDYFRTKSLDQMKDELESELTAVSKGVKGSALRAFRAVYRTVENSNAVLENMSRVSMYITLRDAGYSKHQAATAAKNLTVNFNRKGEAGSLVNSLYLFYNASMQGTHLTLKLMKKPKVQKLLVAAGAGMVALTQYNILFGGEDDDGESNYFKIPDFEKERNLIIMWPDGSGKYSKIPMPYGLNVPLNAAAALTHTINGRDAFKESLWVGASAWNSFSPVGERGWNIITPTVIDPFVEIETNQNFAGKNIMPAENPFEKSKTPDSQRAFDSTNKAYKKVAQTLNEITGGNEQLPGVIDVSPESIQHLVETNTGAAGGFVNRVFDWMTNPDFDPARAPFKRKFYGEKSPYNVGQSYRDKRQHIYYLESRFKYLSERRKLPGGGAALLEFRADNNDGLKLISFLKTTEGSLKKLYEARTSFKDRGLDDRAKEMDEKIQNLQAKFNKKYNAIYLDKGIAESFEFLK